MQPRLYRDLASWWPVLSDPAAYAEEAAIFRHAITATAQRDVNEVLELGCGGGNNASHLKAYWQLTLTDLSPGMLAVSRQLNPECEHVEGDMRTIRLGRSFDAVFVHDAVTYMTTEEDLLACMQTAHLHLRPGGVALFVPDETRESFRPHTKHGGYDRGNRSLRYLEWSYDPDPDDTTTTTAMAYLLKEGDASPEVVYDEHIGGLFPRDTWLRQLAEAGFVPSTLPFPHSSFPPDTTCELFLGAV